MSMHKIPLSELELRGLEAHRLPFGVPSQMSDAFRQGIIWALSNPELKGPEPVKYDLGSPEVRQVIARSETARALASVWRATGNENTMRMAAELLGVGPCPRCDFVKTKCKCPKEPNDGQ